MDKVGIKETMDVLDAAEAAADGVIAACADKKLNVLDLRFALGAMKAAPAAVKGADQIKSEVQDLDEAELSTLIDKVIAVSQKTVQAYAALAETLGS